MEKIKNILRKFDYFGVLITLNYKTDRKYRTSFGGIIFIFFLITCIVYFIVSISQFFSGRTASIIFYNKELNKTDYYSFSKEHTNIAFGLTCGNVNESKYGDIYELISIEMNYETVTREEGGNRVFSYFPVSTHKCKYEDFSFSINDLMDSNGITNNFLCPENLSKDIHGIYSDNLFEYYSVSLNIRDESKSEIVNELLYEYECQFSFYFLNHVISPDNKKNPVSYLLDEKYINISPVSFKELNIFFHLQEFNSFEHYIFDKNKKSYHGAFSRIENYELFKGDDRYISKNGNYKTYAKIYLRADTSRKIIERRYQKLTELLADISSIPSVALIILYFFIDYINRILFIDSIIKIIYLSETEDSSNKNKFKEVFRNKMKEGKIKKINYGDKEIKLENNKDIEQIKEREILIKNTFYNKYLNKNLKTRNIEQRDKKETLDKNITIDSILTNNSPSRNEDKISTTHLAKNEIYKNKRNSIFNFLSFVYPKKEADYGKREIYKEKTLDKKIQKIKDVRSRLFFNRLYGIFCNSPGRGSKTLEKINNNIEEELDVFNYLQLTQMTRLLSYLVLTDEENYFFHVLSKPTAYLGSKNGFNEIIRNNQNNKGNNKEIEILANKIQNLLDKPNKTEREDKISELICLDINNIIE